MAPRATEVRSWSQCEGFGAVQRWQIFFGVLRNLHAITGIIPELDHKVSFPKLWLHCSLIDLSFDTIVYIPSRCSCLQSVTCTPIRGWKLTFLPDDGYWIVKDRATLVQLDRPTNIYIQGGSNMTGTDLCVNKPHCAAAVRPWESEATTSTLPPARVRTCSVLSGSC